MIEQGTDEWFRLKAGKATASEIAIAMSKGTGRAKYAKRLAIERITGKHIDGYKNNAMRIGNELEEEARIQYEFISGNGVEQCAFIDHPTINWSGCSPDGLIVGSDGMTQIKCPEYQTHYDYLTTRKIPTIYQKQMSWEMECAERRWEDFVSYCPHFPDKLQLVIIRYHYDKEMAELQRNEVIEFIKEVDQIEQILRESMK